MGNSTVSLSIKLDYDDEIVPVGATIRPAAVAGTRVSGTVFVDVKKKLDAKQLLIAVEGEESCCALTEKCGRWRKKLKIQSSQDREASDCRSRCRRTRRKILQKKFQVRNWRSGEYLLPGSYDFPFGFDLPSTVPATMSANNGGTSWAEVKYKISTQLVEAGGIRFKKAVERPLLVVSAPLPGEPVPFVVSPVTKDVYERVGVVGLVRRGSVTFDVRLENTRVGRGEEIELEIACRNNTIVDIPTVEVQVMEETTWRAGNALGFSLGQLVSSDHVDFTSLTRRSSKSFGKTTKPCLKSKQRKRDQIFDEMTSTKKVIKLEIPESSRDSRESEIVACRHYLTIGIDTDSLHGDPLEIPIEIGTPAQRYTPHPSGIPVATAVPLEWSRVPVAQASVVDAQS